MKANRRIISLFLTFVMLVGTISGMTLTSSAAEYQQTNTYVLNYNGVYEGSKWQYFSPYMLAWNYENDSDYNNAISFTLYDTVNGKGFATYCTDIAVGLDNNSNFRRINLEDSDYAGAAAGMLRSVVLKGFPNTGVDALGKAAGVEDLTVGEAVAATQAAIWQAAHGDRVQFTDFVYDFDTAWNESATQHYADCYAEIASGYAAEENEALIQSHIEKVFNYLINLEPTAPTGVVASEASFVEWSSQVSEPDANGNCTVTATATVDVNVGSSDHLTLSAVVGGFTASAQLKNGKDTYSLVIPNVPEATARGEVTLAIDGTQASSDVYLFDAVGGRDQSQSLIGITDSSLPVHAEVNANDRVLIINKTDGNRVGLQNITFDIYYVCTVSEYVNGDVTLGTGVTTIDGKEYFSAPTGGDLSKYVTGKLPISSVVTDKNGQATYNFGNDNDGIYIVVERKNAATTGAVSPFFIAVPGGADPDASNAYQIVVEPKNTVIEEDVEIEKDVNQIDNDHDTHDIGETHTWIIQSSIPTGLANAQKYEITDSLNYQLTYVGNLKVTVSEKSAAAGDDLETLVEGEDYVLTVTSGKDKNDQDITSFKVALTKAGMKKVATVEGNQPEIRVYFDAYIDEDAVLGTEIPNQAHVDYKNNVGIDDEADSDIPEVHTGGASLLKVDASNHDKTLAGAAFTVYRPASQSEIESGEIEHITVDGQQLAVVKAAQVTSGEDGRGVVRGLAYGTYYLVETEAPEGYNLLTKPVAIEINATSHTEDAVVKIFNSTKFTLPATGGMGTTLFTCGGIGIIGAAAVVLATGKKKRT